MGNYVDGCSKETGCRRTNEQFTDARTFGKRRQEMRTSARGAGVARGPMNVTRSKSPAGKGIMKDQASRQTRGLADTNEEAWCEEDEGITLYDEVVRA